MAKTTSDEQIRASIEELLEKHNAPNPPTFNELVQGHRTMPMSAEQRAYITRLRMKHGFQATGDKHF